MKQVAILGTGIAGLLSAKAVLELGMQPVLYDRDYSKKPLKGLHYLHDACGMELPIVSINNFIIDTDEPDGTTLGERYCRKVFGEINETAKNNSITTLPSHELAYCMHSAYNTLYEAMEQHFHFEEVDVNKEFVDSIIGDFHAVISTIPLKVVFPKFECKSEKVWSSQTFPEILSNMELGQNCVVYNVNEDESWYRASRVGSTVWTEYVGKPTDVEVFPIRKLITEKIDLDKTFQETGIILGGRYGTWNRKELAHDIYYRVHALLG